MNKDRLQMYISVTRIAIVLCWLSLFSFWALKIFGGNFFEIMVENENFLKFSQAVQNTWLKYLVSFITTMFGNIIMFGAISQKFFFKGKELLFTIIAITSIWFVSNFIPLSFISLPFWYGYFVIIVYGIIKQKGWRRIYGVFAIFLQFAFTSLSMIVRNVNLNVVTDYLMIMILLIDMYIMYILYYLYSNLLRLRKVK